MSTTELAGGRAAAAQAGVRLEVATVAWMAIEAMVAIGAGVTAGSALLTAFGLDSVIELISGGVLLWRLGAEARGAGVERLEEVERRATWISAALLALLCVYVAATGLYGLVSRREAESSPVGIALAAAALVIMPLLARSKRRVNVRLNSAALRADIAESLTCAYMAATVLGGLLLNAALGWWWAEYLALAALLYFLIGETREAWEAARGEGEHAHA